MIARIMNLFDEELAKRPFTMAIFSFFVFLLGAVLFAVIDTALDPPILVKLLLLAGVYPFILPIGRAGKHFSRHRHALFFRIADSQPSKDKSDGDNR